MRKQPSNPISHPTDSTMATIDLTEDSDEESHNDTTFTFIWSGPPKAMPRSRFYNRGLFNARKGELMELRKHVVDAYPQTQHSPLFPQGIPVKMVIKCYLRRPNSDFKKEIRDEFYLTRAARSTVFIPITPDVDNLAKFVMDALNTIVYHDDKQVVVLEVQKKRDNIGICFGRTIIEVTQMC